MSSESVIKRFARETHFVGVREAAETKSLFWKLYWCILVAVATVCTAIALYKTFAEYRDDSLVTVITQYTPTQFPIIAICPVNWINETKVKSINFTAFDALALSSVVVQSSFDVETEVDSGKLPKFHHLSPTALEQPLVTLLDQISYDPEEILELWEPDSKVQLSKLINGNAVCYQINNTRIFKRSEIRFASTTIVLPAMEQPFGWGRYEDLEGIGFMFNLDFGIPDLSSTIWLPDNQSFLIMFQAQHIKRCKSCQQKCRDYSADDRDKCAAMELNKKCLELGMKPLFIGEPNLNETLHSVSNYYDYNSHCLYTLENLSQIKTPFYIGPTSEVDIFEQAESKCPQPCESFFFHPTIIPRSYDEDYVTITFSYLNPSNSWRYEEYSPKTFATFLNDVGGGLSLWTGASLLSLFHLPYFCFARALGVVKRNLSRKIANKNVISVNGGDLTVVK